MHQPGQFSPVQTNPTLDGAEVVVRGPAGTLTLVDAKPSGEVLGLVDRAAGKTKLLCDIIKLLIRRKNKNKHPKRILMIGLLFSYFHSISLSPSIEVMSE